MSCLRIVEHLQPPLFIAECVKKLSTKDQATGKSAFQTILEIAAAMSYAIELYHVDAKEYEARESRTRSYLFAFWVGRADALARLDTPAPHARQQRFAFQSVLEFKISPLPLGEYLKDTIPTVDRRPREEEVAVQSSSAAPERAAKRRKQGPHARLVKQPVLVYQEKHLEVYTEN